MKNKQIITECLVVKWTKYFRQYHNYAFIISSTKCFERNNNAMNVLISRIPK